jgi:CubicO group peptidase (beta-lactamase class C family)
MLQFLVLSFLFASQVASQASIACPVVSKTYSPPQNISSSSIWEKAIATLNQNLSKLVTQNISVAIQIHSKDSTDPLFEYYRKSPGHSYGPNGQKPVDGDTIFRIGSMTKMFTVYALLIECGFTCFEEPITKYVPELRNLKYDNEIDNVNWEEIMIGALAAQISGIGRDCMFNVDFDISILRSLCLFPTSQSRN